jgi:predicted regulator of Ras-like GTPase activity (Roadblock/LC7/MglB family)
MSKEIKKNRKHQVKAVIIASSNGIPLVSVKIDERFEEELIAPFFSAIKNFSDQKLGSLKESLIKGGEHDVLVVQQHGLILIAIMDSSLKKIDIEDEAKQALHNFHKMFEQEIESLDTSCLDLNVFKQFENSLKQQIREYYEKIDGKEKGEGFFSKLFSSFRK